MATYSLGTVPSPIAQQARLQALAGPQVNPLDSLIQGFAQGQALQQLPQQIAQQQLANQLAIELQQQKLLDLRDPNRAIARELNRQLAIRSIDPASGIVRSVPGFEGQTIATPQALLPATQQFVEAGGDPTEFIGLRPPGPAITPILGVTGQPTGFASDLTVPEAISESKLRQGIKKLTSEEAIKQKFELERIDARNKARGFNTYVNPEDPTDIRNLDPTERPPEGFMNVKDYFKKGGPGNKGSGSGGGGDLKPTGETQEKFLGGVNLLGQVDEALAEAESFRKSGTFPSYSQTAINQFLTQRPQDIPGAGVIPGISSIYAAAQRGVREAQTPQSRDLQMRKAQITSTILRTQAGLSQTLGETVNISPYTPSESDTYESLVDKLKRLRAEGSRSLVNYRKLYPQLRNFEIPGLDDGAPAPAQAPGITRIPGVPLIRTKQEFDDLPPGTRYMEEDGLPYIKP